MNKDTKELNDWMFKTAVGIVTIDRLTHKRPVNTEKLLEDANDIQNEQRESRGEED